MTEEYTHFIAYDSPYLTVRFPRYARAYCGKLVDPKSHDNNPTCPTCKNLVDQETAEAEEFLRKERSDA